MPQLNSFAEAGLSLLPEPILAAIAGAPMPGLADGPRDSELAALISEEQQLAALEDGARDLCAAGLWLLAGDLDRSHTISQTIKSADGSFWHGIMHRREGDFGNSKYWFGRVGPHPVLERLGELSGGIYVDPFEFVDACSRAVKQGGGEAEQCKKAQWLEWQALMAHGLS